MLAFPHEHLFSVIEAEIRYACRHEYAQTAVDFIARRCRLAFLNAQTALDVLPRVIDIMAGELGWSSSRRRKELQDGALFLESMGLAAGVEVEPASRTWLEWAKSTMLGMKQKPDGRMYSRAQFEAGEVDSLKDIFATRAKGAPGVGETEGRLRVKKEDIRVILRETPGYENVRSNEFNYVLDEAGFSKRDDFDFDEFVEVGGKKLVDWIEAHSSPYRSALG